MGNSPLVTYTNLTKNCTKPRRKNIDAVIIHCVVGQCTAKQGCDYFATTDRECSANYVVGKDGSIGLSVDEANRAWTSGGSLKVNGISGADWDHRAVTIEVASDTSHPYAVTGAAYEALIKLVADICKRNGIKKLLWKGDKSLVGKIDQQNMAVHRWFANKSCPGDYLYERMGDIASRANALIGVAASEPEKPTNEEPEFAVGDIVKFTGTKHYISSNSTNGKTCKPGKARVTAVAAKGRHPVQLIAVPGGGSNVYGWVDTASIARESANLAVGAKVKVNAGAKTYTGGGLASFVYKNTYDVIRINGDRVVIGIGKAVTAAMNKKDLTVV